MNILVQRTTIWAIAAFFGCVSLLGPGWHSVFGHHYHGDCQGVEACAHSTADASTAHRHTVHRHAGCCTPQRSAAPATAAGDASRQNGEPSIVSLVTPGHHCPLCQFFGTAQWAPSFVPAELNLVATQLPTATAASCDCEAPRRYLSRAPPHDSAHC